MGEKKRLIVIGGGAAGFFCAVNAARMNKDLQVTLLERSSKLLSKVRISGGGRCNVTHASFEIGEMSRNYPRGENFVKKAFHQFFTNDTIQWFEERGVKLKTEKDGRMFPTTDSSQTIIDCLMREVNKYGVQVRMNTEITRIEKKDGEFNLHTDKEILKADVVCVATGGYPKPNMFNWLTELGHSIEPPVPSLFTFNMPGNPICELMGVSVDDARVRITGTKLEEQRPLLITHWGMSGPAILRLSAFGARSLAEHNWHFNITVNWIPHFNEQSLRDKFRELRTTFASQKITNRNPFALPARLWEFLLSQSGLNNDTRWADLLSKEMNKLIINLVAYPAEVKGKTTFKEEFVTAGGIRLNEIDPNTMMSKKIPSLFFAGEIMDVDGVTGGFNFQHAWTSAFIAAKAIVNNP